LNSVSILWVRTKFNVAVELCLSLQICILKLCRPYILYLNTIKTVSVRRRPLDSTVLSFVWFCVDMPEVDLSIGRNMQHNLRLTN